MRIDYLNNVTGAGTEAQTVMVNDIPEVKKVSEACGTASQVVSVVATVVYGWAVL